MGKFFTAYASYIKALPQVEQNSQRYKGQLPQAEFLAQYFTAKGNSSGDADVGKTGKADTKNDVANNPLLKLLQTRYAPVTKAGPKDKIILSDQAKRALKQG